MLDHGQIAGHLSADFAAVGGREPAERKFLQMVDQTQAGIGHHRVGTGEYQWCAKGSYGDSRCQTGEHAQRQPDNAPALKRILEQACQQPVQQQVRCSAEQTFKYRKAQP